MVVFVLERVPVGLRGELTRWLLEPKTGVFVGRISAMVRERLWIKVMRANRHGGAIMIHPSDSEQGFVIWSSGRTSRSVVDFDGLSLIARKD